MEDTRIIEHIQSDCPRRVNVAVGVLYERHRRMVTSLIRQHGGSAFDADDVMQNTVLSFVRTVRAGEYNSQTPIGGFFGLVAKRQYLNLLANSESRTRRDHGYYFEHLSESELTTGLDALVNEDERREAMRGFERLSKGCRAILMARGEGHSMREVAELLGLKNFRTAISMKHKCMECLKKRMA